tara:strand:- start:1329 stop:1487 length:159 start_codon:yes stop_codon:yes gene_type:complete
MSPAFFSGITEHLPKAEVTVDWFYIVQTFTKWLDDARNTLMGLVCLEIRPGS